MTAPTAAPDAAILQTASSLAVLTTETYRSLQALPFGGGAAAVPLLRDFLASALVDTARARDALGDATRQAGGRVQRSPDPQYAPVVAQALPTLRVPGDVVSLALTLEDVLAQTLVRDAIDLGTPALRGLAGSLGAAAAARKALLLIMQALLSTGQAGLVVAPPDLTALPPGIGTVGFPDTRFPTDKASPPTEGSLG